MPSSRWTSVQETAPPASHGSTDLISVGQLKYTGSIPLCHLATKRKYGRRLYVCRRACDASPCFGGDTASLGLTSRPVQPRWTSLYASDARFQRCRTWHEAVPIRCCTPLRTVSMCVVRLTTPFEPFNDGDGAAGSSANASCRQCRSSYVWEWVALGGGSACMHHRRRLPATTRPSGDLMAGAA